MTTEREQNAELLAGLKRIQLKVEPGRSGAWTLDDAVREVAWIDAECRRVAVIADGGRGHVHTKKGV